MNVLTKGSQTLERVELLLSLTSIRSDDMQNAIKSHLIGGLGESAAAALNSVDRNNLIKTLAKLNEKALVVERIKEIDWAFVMKETKRFQKVTTLKQVS